MFFAVVTGSGSGKLCWHSRGTDNDQENAGYVRESAGGSEQALRLRAQAGAFRAPARVPFFFCKKKGTKENHLDLRSKDPLARCGSCRFGGMHSRMKCGGGRCRFGGSLVPLAPLPLTTARVGAGTLVVFGDYQIAPIAARSTAMGRWRLTPPGYGGRRLRAGRGTGDTSSVSFAGTCLPAGRSVRGSDTPPACHSTPRTPQGEGFGGVRHSRGRLGRQKEAPGGASFGFVYLFLAVQVRPVRDRSDRAA